MTDTQRAAFEAWASSEDMSTATGNCGWYIADGTAKAWRAWVAAQAADAGMEDQPSITNPLTPYGMLVRALRIVAGTTLYDMAKALLTTPAKLSSMEFGRIEVTPEFAFDIAAHFDALGIPGTQQAISASLSRAKEQK